MGIGIVIADHHELMRDALSTLVTTQLGATVLANVKDAQAALVACQRHRPDLLLLDVDMPGRDALSIMPEVCQVSPETRMVILTAHCHDALIQMAINAGVCGYLLKSDSVDEVAAALRSISGGHKRFSPSVQARLAVAEGPGLPDRQVEVTRLSRLAPREREVLRYIGRGMDNGEMARIMYLSKRTVERHVSRLMKSLDIHDRAGLQRFASIEHVSP